MKIYIVGAGPGDPDLITVKGLNILQTADVILYTDSLVNEELIAKAKPDAEVLKTAGMHLEEIVGIMVDRVKEGKMVARIHTGDPAMYGAIMEQIVLLKKEDIGYEVIPGVSSVFASAAAIGAELTIPDLTQTLILTRAEGRTPVPEFEKLRDLASHHCTIALFLSATLTKKIVKELKEAGWKDDTPVAVIQRATWPDQKIVRTTLVNLDDDMRKNGIRKHAMILAGWALDPTIHDKDEYRSKLYDASFTHGFRKGVKP
ncbi:precorrin-4 C(11)-methyltransferase [Peribacillus simplex]|jgi:precorrin-4/cobalt-precorrin-4 C11-methyltransferase|uniref:Precorrin-4 C(11)-methyltransferase n=1 Tax=Peribacillus simplex TaxID=1478 RepID=A0AAW7IUD5_9BACI|nr:MULTISPECIES: precorrin-4 C(11)-methyltransferase [Peribacillus]SNT20871.1 precorrin-4/cobalt-precorrin-4 C11-methyltransferase [Bacillus sp. OK838]MDM5294967.1 precorrin-4 C(11)-methyltransferase [Peribacillus simplex]MDM5453928.1 precorrin-4 C(11)-methyltransferase [Peribacillus simplex]MDV7764838.1 precorrin-4 C(11)-methyltransferase [Peribacillus sp. CSMR9]MDW7615673.1 precorrin-4 C(11)-methyltransferase [Peribacillus simplex]